MQIFLVNLRNKPWAPPRAPWDFLPSLLTPRVSDPASQLTHHALCPLLTVRPQPLPLGSPLGIRDPLPLFCTAGRSPPGSAHPPLLPGGLRPHSLGIRGIAFLLDLSRYALLLSVSFLGDQECSDSGGPRVQRIHSVPEFRRAAPSQKKDPKSIPPLTSDQDRHLFCFVGFCSPKCQPPPPPPNNPLHCLRLQPVSFYNSSLCCRGCCC